jgi:hypothetical protein
MKKHEMTISDLSKHLDCPYIVVYQLLSGKRFPSLKRAIAIEQKTNGAVRCIDWMSVKNEPGNRPQKYRKKANVHKTCPTRDPESSAT